MELIEYADREMLGMGLADALASSLRGALSTHDRASFCVPGGSSPREVFALLSGTRLDWDRVDVFLNDERWVPESDPLSNTAMVKATLLTDLAAKARWVPMHVDAPDPEAGIPALLPGFEGRLPISVLLLGMGEDMHTASLFPGSADLAAAMADDAPVLMAARPPGKAEARVTLTAPVLAGALDTHFLVMGEAKRSALDVARTSDPMDAPAAAFLRGATVHWAP
ncbi:6-phosphogluconolactonase [Jannaschia sp. W003]|uniref:6-phosphogluconolactonase n=1 Tax=Jannaschia sp. W003 TaxID=2867012 RepID=UPI0021A4B4BC|nr:6-phosphogluconolactonase [Jannaschia sp. W003]UWQ20424.1 6-phosphogluconolactonase [Jannaschia sp. W003]